MFQDEYCRFTILVIDKLYSPFYKNRQTMIKHFLYLHTKKCKQNPQNSKYCSKIKNWTRVYRWFLQDAFGLVSIFYLKSLAVSFVRFINLKVHWSVNLINWEMICKLWQCRSDQLNYQCISVHFVYLLENLTFNLM